MSYSRGGADSKMVDLNEENDVNGILLMHYFQ